MDEIQKLCVWLEDEIVRQKLHIHNTTLDQDYYNGWPDALKYVYNHIVNDDSNKEE